MPGSSERILATHEGSRPRRPALITANVARAVRAVRS